jgi:putative transcriptional regulator
MRRSGSLLVANPRLPDPNFDRTVVLLIAHNEEGALGLVLNRPSRMEVAEPLPQWEHLAAEPAVLFLGGPVRHEAVICLARNLPDRPAPSGPTEAAGSAPRDDSPDRTDDRTDDDDAEDDGWKEVVPGVATIDLDQDPGAVSDRVRQVRMFAGYAGWSAGQLEAEIATGAWWIVDAEASDPFTVEPTDLWERVLRRQSFPLAYVSWYPDNPAHQ